MIGLLRRWLCSRGRHNVLRCAGAEDHAWTWDAQGQRWTATLDRVPPPAPVGRFRVVEDTHGLVLVPVDADQPVHAPTPPAGKNDHGRVPAPRHQA